MKPDPTIETAVKVLNEAFAADPAAIKALCVNRVPCNQALADHPVIWVHPDLEADVPHVGLLGILNGVLESMTGKRAAMVWDGPKVPGGACKWIGFQVYDPATYKKTT